MTDKIVEKAINALTKRINISSGLSHPMDKDAAIDILILLKAEGHLFSAEEIKILAQRNGWGSTGANDLYQGKSLESIQNTFHGIMILLKYYLNRINLSIISNWHQ